MTGFEPLTSDIGSDRSANGATTTALMEIFSFLKNGPSSVSFPFFPERKYILSEEFINVHAKQSHTHPYRVVG